ncbi:hypothetical protein [Hymenobacter gelipurpurascens]|nr:hypothetical protein [Hymenobacter gelipurpurascens]
MPDTPPLLPDAAPEEQPGNDMPSLSTLPGLAGTAASSSIPELGFQLLPPPAPEVFPLVRSEDGRMALTNEALEVDGQTVGWRELEAVDVQPVRWLLWFLLGGFTLAGFMLAFLQNWLRTIPAAAGMAAGALLLAFGARGSNRWRLHRPGREVAYFALPGAARSWQQLAAEANRRIRQRHDEAAASTTYWMQRATWPPAAPGSLPTTEDGF